MILEFVILAIVFSCVVMFAVLVIPLILERFRKAQDQKVAQAEKELEKMFVQVKRERLFLLYTLSPLVLGIAGFLFFQNIAIVALGVGLGFGVPALVLKYTKAKRRMRFQSQLIDGVMILSSSLKGGLSLIQAIEVLVEEMPAPLSQEFGLVLRENKMGMDLEVSLRHLQARMSLDEVALLISSILVARETGGDLTKVLSRLTTTIRDNRKLKDTVRTLTLQGRLQGMIMSVLPFIFIWGVMSYNKHYFDVMLSNETGRMLLIIAAVLMAVGLFLIRKFSTVKL